MASDGQLALAVSRLTENEKECLRRCLLPQTAKEMAIELGISVHAVEKRLKMARTKLRLTSSLEAARQLAKLEGYDRLVPHSPDLARRGPIGDGAGAAAAATLSFQRHHLVIILGVSIMGLMLAALAVLLSQSNSADQSRGIHPPADDIQTRSTADASAAKPAMRPASPGEVRDFLASSFSTMDRDHSGFIERAEAPARFGIGQPSSADTKPENVSVTWLTGTTAQAMWISKSDTNADGKVSQTEYIDWSFPIYSRVGGVPANWKRKP